MASSRRALRLVGLGVLVAALCGFVGAMIPGATRWGYADWECTESRPYGWVRSDRIVIDSLGATTVADVSRALSIAAHEEQHVKDMRALGVSCIVEFGMRGNLNYVRRIETRGKCAEADALVRLGLLKAEDARQYVVNDLVTLYPLLFLNPVSAADLVTRHCGDVRA